MAAPLGRVLLVLSLAQALGCSGAGGGKECQLVGGKGGTGEQALAPSADAGRGLVARASYADPARDALPAADPAGDVPDRVAFLDQGWTPADSLDFYTRPQGSRLVPYRWFLALEQADSGRPFRDPANLARLGYLPQKPSRWNPDGLPVGFVNDPRRDGETFDWFGFTCAACHTAEVRYGGTAYRVDGGPSPGDIDRLLTELTAALKATLDDPAKFDRFAAAVLPGLTPARDAADLRRQVEEAYQARREYDDQNRPPHPYGYARLDAFGRIVNRLLVDELGVTDEAQRKAPDAPVSYPFLWDTPHHDYVQWNASARNTILGSGPLGGLARNVGQVIGVFGEVRVSEPHTATVFTGYRSSVRVPDLLHLEELVRRLQSPRWPAAFPPVDEETRAAGEALFADYCRRCHAPIDRADPYRTVTAVKTPVRAVGTDPLAARNFASRTGSTGRLGGRRMFFATGERFGPEASADAVLAHAVVGVILGSAWGQYDPAHLALLREGREPTTRDPDRLMVYKARPLNGVWATAPFLHNGSVPTLYHLLLPAEQRPAEFWVGRREFDPADVGFRSDPFPGGFRFRTRDDAGRPVPGNSNAGHEYGTGRDGRPPLTEAQRRQLVEYLKSL